MSTTYSDDNHKDIPLATRGAKNKFRLLMTAFSGSEPKWATASSDSDHGDPTKSCKDVYVLEEEFFGAAIIVTIEATPATKNVELAREALNHMTQALTTNMSAKEA